MPIYFKERTATTNTLLKKTTNADIGQWYFTFTGRDSEHPSLKIILLRETVTKVQRIKKETKLSTVLTSVSLIEK